MASSEQEFADAHPAANELSQLRLLFDLSDAVSRAQEPAEIYQTAVHGLVRCLGADRGSILIFDPDEVMRFKAWVGLSDEYRSAVEGHTPWRRGDLDCQPITIADVLHDPSLSAYHEALAKEGIVAVAFIPLLASAGLIGKFMLYYNAPHEFQTEELQVAQTMAAQVAFAAERQSASIALRQSEERFRAMFSQAAVGIAQIGIAGDWKLANDRLCDILGYTRAELLGMTTLDLTHADDRKTSLVAIQQLLAGEASSRSMEKRYIRKDGAIVWAKLNIALVRADDNAPQYFVTVIEDITNRVHTEQALRESEERFRQLAENIEAVFWIRTPDLQKVLYISPNVEKRSGRSRQKLYQEEEPRSFIEAIHPEDRWRVAALLAHPPQHGFEIEYRIFDADGTFKWLRDRGFPVRDSSGQIYRFAGVAEDITERKRTEEALRESEARFRNMADTAPVMIRVSGPDTGCTFFNKGWLDFTGRTMGQEVGNGWLSSVHPDDVDRCFASDESPISRRQKFQMEYRLRRADGEYRWVLDGGVPRTAADNTFGGYICSAVDITDLRRAQEESTDRQKLESLGVLASGVAHDFNNLLSGILAQVEVAETELHAGSTSVDWLQRIKGVAIRGSEIVRALMTYAGRSSQDLVELVSLSQLVEEMVDLLKVSVSKQVIMEIDLGKNLPLVKGNAAQLRQIVMNLIINASEAIGEGKGIITVTARPFSVERGAAYNQPTGLPEGDYVRLDISDTGCGIRKEDQAKIFDPFYTTKFTGRGLGLSIVKGIVGAHGGAITLTSAPGEGATFQVYLPSSDQSTVDHGIRSQGESLKPQDERKKTLLLVEDEDSLRTPLARILRDRGFSVLEAADGDAAISMFRRRSEEIDFVLLDLTIPGASSRDVIEETQRIRPGVRLVIMSAYSREMAALSLDKYRIQTFIRKPFTPSELLQFLQDSRPAAH